MSLDVAGRIVDFIYSNLKKKDRLEIGFFGGEPLLEFNRVREITALIQNHPGFDPERVTISLVTNGTILTDEIITFLADNQIVLCISCDGPPAVHNANRHFRNGKGSSRIVEKNMRRALEHFPLLPVNAVYSPETLSLLPKVVEYLLSLGNRNIYLNPEISARWTREDAEKLPKIYREIARMYLDYYARGESPYINLINSKVALILHEGYGPGDRCKMGSKEFAFTPSGNIYPCERLVGSGDGGAHCIGNINREFIPGRTCPPISCSAVNTECVTCGIRKYCMNWCGCTNYHSTGRYDVVSPFICASERAAIETALIVIEHNEQKDLTGHVMRDQEPAVNGLHS